MIPPQSNQTILVLGAEGLGRTVAQAAHRPALYARLAGAEEGSVVTPALAARMLRAEGLHDRVFVNQADDWERWRTLSAPSPPSLTARSPRGRSAAACGGACSEGRRAPFTTPQEFGII